MRNYEKRKRLKPKTKNGYVYKEYLYKQKNKYLRSNYFCYKQLKKKVCDANKELNKTINYQLKYRKKKLLKNKSRN